MAGVRYSYATVAAASIAGFVAERYPFAAVAGCHLVRRGLNDTYDLIADGRRYVLRLSRHGRRRKSDLAYEAALLAHLARSGVPVAATVRGRDRRAVQTLATVEGPRLALLFEFVDGRPPAATAADARAQGETLARIHVAGDGFAGTTARFSLDLEHLVARPLAAIATLLADRAEERRYLEALGRRLRDDIRDRAPLMSRGHCHGDCHGLNARIGADGEAVFFDFDDGGPGWLAYDLAVFRWNLRFSRARQGLWRNFLDGYQARRRIAPADLDAVPIFVPIRHIWLVGEWVAGADEWGREWIGHSLEQQVAFLKAWEKEHAAARPSRAGRRKRRAG